MDGIKMKLAFLLLSSLVWALDPPALAQGTEFQANIELTDRSLEQLGRGGRTRVIVQFEHDRTAFDGLLPNEAERAVMRQIQQEREAVFSRVFGVNSLTLATGEQPRLARTYDFTPAALMFLTRAEIEALASDSGVDRIETDRLERALLDGSVAEIGANLLHQAGIDGTGATIAVLDTGIDYDHPAFAGRISASACFSSTVAEDASLSACAGAVASDTTTPRAASYCYDSEIPLAECYHGTHVASIAAGASAEGYPYSGVAPGANLVPVQVFSEFGGNPEICGTQTRCALSYVSDQIAALEWIYANRETLGVNVINMSLGGALEPGSCNSDPRTGIIYQLKVAHIATVVAAGNDGDRGRMTTPACITHTVSVAARGINGQVAQFSNVSVLTRVAAPGENISAAGPSSTSPPVTTQSGTSMAAPHVAGAFAIAHSLFPNLSPDQLLLPMIETGTPLVWRTNHAPVPSIRLDLTIAALSARHGSDEHSHVSPEGSMTLYGPPGPGSAVGSGQFTITNNGSDAQNWTVYSEASWLAFSTAAPGSDDEAEPRLSGMIAAGESIVVHARPTGNFSEGRNNALVIFRVGEQVFARTIFVEISEYRPANDLFANALPTGLIKFTYQDVSLAHASLEAGESHPDGATNSLWYSFVPYGTRVYALETTARSSRVYANGPANLNAYSLVTEVEDIPSSRVRVQFDAVAGERVYIALADPTRTEVDFQLDEFGSGDAVASSPFHAIRLDHGSGLVDRRTRFTTRPGESEPRQGQSFAHRAWFVWTAPYTGTLSLSDEGQGDFVATALAVFQRTDGAWTHGPDDSWDLLEPIGHLDMPSTPPGEGEAPAVRELQVSVEEGRTYWFRVGSNYSSTWRFRYGQPRLDGHALRSAVLPNSRRVLLGQTATAFMTVINPARFGTEARNCRVAAENIDDSVVLEYRLTDSANRAYGPINPLFDLPPGGSQSLVFSVRSSFPANTGPAWRFFCDNLVALEQPRGADDFRVRTATVPDADIIAIASTPSGDGIIGLQSTGTRAFAVAAVNIGATSANVEVRPSEFPFGFGARTEICETNPSTGLCVSPRGPRVVVPSFAAEQVRTFTVFVNTSNFSSDFNPSEDRIRVEFHPQFESGETLGRTSVAYRVLN
ncbi:MULTISPECIES: S8 family peptidase [Hyphobacterium]|uniref:S8 family serine peptidase n=1 Tax=Hyphobacterium vulgare TaxID=1736751 RepID=A0ABV6ZXC9_9PROT